MASSIAVTHLSDPGCPWAYSASPALAVLRWRYGAQLNWRLVMIGLAESPDRYEAAGYTPARMATGQIGFERRFGMPFGRGTRARLTGTGRACRAVVATRLLAPGREAAALRALQFAQFTTTALLDADEAIAEALRAVDGLDARAVVGALDAPETTAAYEADRALARTAAGSPTAFQGRSANTDGAERYTAPSLIFTAGDGRTLEAGGFQPVEAYDVLIANLDRGLTRRAPSDDVAEIVTAFADGICSAEVAAIATGHLEAPDADAVEQELVAAAARGAVRPLALGCGTLWRPGS